MPRSHSSTATPRFVSPLSPVGSNHHQTPLTPLTPLQPSSSLFSSVKEGFGLGVGSSIGRNLVDKWFGAGSKSNPPSYTNSGSAPPVCAPLQTSFTQCIQEKKPYEECKQALESLNKCLELESSAK